MQLRSTSIVGGFALALSSSAAIAGGDTVTIEIIPGVAYANDMSADGRWIVGDLDQDGDFVPDGTYLLDTSSGNLSQLPPPGLLANGVSDNGGTVLGDMTDPVTGNTVAGIWKPVVGWQSLGSLPGADCDSILSAGWELSGDGTTAVGFSWKDGCAAHGFRWTAATGMQELELLANGVNRASVVSADGSVIGGFAQGSFSRTPALWDASGDGTLLDPPNGDMQGEVYGMRDDGSVMVGTWYPPTENNSDAVKWTFNGTGWDREMIASGSLFSGWGGIPMDIADDGTIVGFDFLLGNRRAWIQPQGTGPILDLKAWIEGQGAVVPGDIDLQVCQAISTDGRTMIGHGLGTGAWRITITPACDADLGGDGSVGFADLNQVLAAWGPCAACPEDIDGDGNVGFTDLNTVLAAWGPCP